MKLTNTLTKTLEEFKPINPPSVGMYTCGMTVYDYAHIGHGRKYVTDDILKRALTAKGYVVKHVQNVTDVGHLTSDSDTGEDKLEKGAKKYGKTVWEVAEFFTKHFYDSMDKLNIIRPDVIAKATENIAEQITMIEKLVAKGFAYDTPEAVYFEVSKFESYGSLFGQDLSEKIVAAREEVKEGSYKRSPADFVLWFKRVGKYENHTMHWDSPWGDGFPGWHIECSAMATKYLSDQFDIHTGGEDHISVHHPNEIAQSEAASGKHPFARFWIHTTFLTVNGEKMSKSTGNFYTVEDVEKKGFNPISLRYFYLTAHYRRQVNFTWEALEASENAYKKLQVAVDTIKKSLGSVSRRTELSEEKLVKVDKFQEDFLAAIENDLNTPQALAVVWQTLKSNIPSGDKLDLLRFFDEVLGLSLFKEKKIHEVPVDVMELANKRETLRKEGKYGEADRVRDEIESKGYAVLDTKEGIRVTKK